MARIDFVTGNAQRYLPHVEALATLPDAVKQALAGHSPESVAGQPAEGRWPPVRVLRHMLFYAVENQHNLHRMVWQDAPAMSAWDEDETASERGWDALPAPALLDAFTAAIAETVELLRELPDAAWGRPGLHHRRGRRSISQMADLSARHHRQHIAQIEDALSA